MDLTLNAGEVRRLASLDDADQIPRLFELGLTCGERQIRPDHFSSAFDL